jgi:hypothetical protein
MSATTQPPSSPPRANEAAPSDGSRPAKPAAAELVSWKAGVGLGFLAVLGTILFGFMANTKTAGFRIAEARDPNASSAAAWVTLVVALAAAAYLGYLWIDRRRTRAGVDRWIPATTGAAVVVLGLAALGVAGVEKVAVPPAAANVLPVRPLRSPSARRAASP